MTFPCPFCNYTADTISEIKKHIKLRHWSNYCPVCKKRCKSVVLHCYFEGTYDDPHAMLYYFYSRPRSRKTNISYIIMQAGIEYYIKEYCVPFWLGLFLGRLEKELGVI